MEDNSAQSLGHSLLRDRVALAQTELVKLLDQPEGAFSGPEFHMDRPVVITGLGSSAAHAQFLLFYLQAAGFSARYCPITQFFHGEVDLEGHTLIVFSQGLSSNAQIALGQRHQAEGLVLFTSSTMEGLKTAGKPDCVALLQSLLAEGAHIVSYPLEDEYTLFVRVVGPLCGFGAVIRYLHDQEIVRFEMPSGETLHQLMELAVTDAAAFDLEGLPIPDLGFDFVFGDPLFHFGQNLSLKWVEGAFMEPPACIDAFDFSHGFFQLRTTRPKPVWLLSSESESGEPLDEALTALFESGELPGYFLKAPVTAPWSIFYFECFFNALLVRYIVEYQIDQINWPGKGLDGPMYKLKQAYSYDSAEN